MNDSAATEPCDVIAVGGGAVGGGAAAFEAAVGGAAVARWAVARWRGGAVGVGGGAVGGGRRRGGRWRGGLRGRGGIEPAVAARRLDTGHVVPLEKAPEEEFGGNPHRALLP